jgi:hypothetical protein
LEIFTMSGQKVKTVYQGYITAGIQRYTLNLPAQQRSHLFYILRVGGEKVTGKLLHAGSN